jgi:hypothetical protein
LVYFIVNYKDLPLMAGTDPEPEKSILSRRVKVKERGKLPLERPANRH